jgi:hypothetical protein
VGGHPRQTQGWLNPAGSLYKPATSPQTSSCRDNSAYGWLRDGGGVTAQGMFKFLAVALISLPSVAGAADQAFAPGKWDVTSTSVEVSIPGLPGFIERMMQGKSKAEHKRLSAGQGMEALIAPDPQARCHIDVQHVADGNYNQTLSCPQKRGEPVQVIRSGTYDRSGFVGRATVTGTTAKGPLRIVLNQRAARVSD